MKNRLLDVMDELELPTRRALAEFCGVSEGLVSQWFSGDTDLGPKPLLAFSKTKFNLEWIAAGKLPKYKTAEVQHLLDLQHELEMSRNLVDPEDLKKIVTVFCNSDAEQRDSILKFISAMEEDQKLPSRRHKPKNGR